VAAPLAGVVLADYVVLKRQEIDVPALFDPAGRYRYLDGINVSAIISVAVGVAVFYVVPNEWLKIAWGIGVGGGTYLALAWLQAIVGRRVARAYAATIASSHRSSSPS
jgi:NCS1 family nucleobase:cation symporter-1